MGAAIAEARRLDVEQGASACRECGCTDNVACPGGCWWVEPDLCSTCAALPTRRAATPGPLKLISARRRALEVLARAVNDEARESNETSDWRSRPHDEHDKPLIYWQTRAWLSEQGLIIGVPGKPDWYRLTVPGCELVAELGLR